MACLRATMSASSNSAAKPLWEAELVFVTVVKHGRVESYSEPKQGTWWWRMDPISDKLISLCFFLWIRILGKFGECISGEWAIRISGNGNWNAWDPGALRVESDTKMRPSGQALTTKHQPSSYLPQHRGILIPSMGYMSYVYMYICIYDMYICIYVYICFYDSDLISTGREAWWHWPPWCSPFWRWTSTRWSLQRRRTSGRWSDRWSRRLKPRGKPRKAAFRWDVGRLQR